MFYMLKTGLKFKENPVSYVADKVGFVTYNALTFPKYLMPKQRCFKNILFTSVGTIADSVLSLPTLDALGKFYKRSEITVLTTSQTEFLFKDKDYVKEIKLVPADYFTRPSKEAFKEFLSQYGSLFVSLKKAKFDLAFELRSSPKNILFFTNALMAKRRMGHGMNGLGYFLTDDIKFNQNVHSMINKLELLKPIHVPVETPKVSKTLKFKLKKSSVEKANDLLKQWKVPNNGKFITFSFNYHNSLQQYPVEKQVNLIKSYLTSNKTQRIIVIDSGSLDNSELGIKLAEELDKKIFKRVLFSSVDELGLEIVSGILKKSDVFIGSNLDFLHLASAVGTKTVGVYGSIDTNRWAVFGKRKNHSSVQIKGKNKTPEEMDISLIEPDLILETLKKL